MRGLGSLPCYPWMLFLPFKEAFTFLYTTLANENFSLQKEESLAKGTPVPECLVVIFLDRFIVSGVDTVFSGTFYVT